MTITVAPHPTYEVPPTLRQAIVEGVDITALDADTIGYLASGTMLPETIKSEAVLYRHVVTAALRGLTTYCVPRGSIEGGYEYQWPSQDRLAADQWWADLLTEPELLPDVLERLTPDQRDTVRSQVAMILGDELEDADDRSMAVQNRRRLGIGDSCDDALTCRNCAVPIPPECVYITTDVQDVGDEHVWCIACIEAVVIRAKEARDAG